MKTRKRISSIVDVIIHAVNRYKSAKAFTWVFIMLLSIFATVPASAHCDSYDGPVIKEAMKALETNNVDLILKWITPEQTEEVVPLFKKTYSLKNGDPEIYTIVKEHFLETLVRLHRETEGAPYTGLKPAGDVKDIIKLSDQALSKKDIGSLLTGLNSHINTVITEKYEKVAKLDKVKDVSPVKGREYVAAYVDYTHTLEALHDILLHGIEHDH